MSIFFAFPSQPRSIAADYAAAAAKARRYSWCPPIRLWNESETAGQPLWQTIAYEIQRSAGLCADITSLNKNVVYELGYAVGLRKPIFLFVNQSLPSEATLRTQLGFFDIIGQSYYHDQDSLAKIIQNCAKRPDPVFIPDGIDNKAAVFLVDSLVREGLSARIKSRVKEQIVFFRSFDPNETVRMPLNSAVSEVARALGVILYFVPITYADANIHNLRSAFIGGLASGLGKCLLFISVGDEGTPLDYRDITYQCFAESHIDKAVDDFALRLLPLLQQQAVPKRAKGQSFLESLNVGASVAENEFQSLSRYYLRVDAYLRANRGEVRIVTGRKGAGKTALFAYLRGEKRKETSNIVVDLKPEGYKLVKFREDVLTLVQHGSQEHLLTALWDYIILLELAHKILEDDKSKYRNDHRITSLYDELREAYSASSMHTEGDFSERLGYVLTEVARRLKAMAESSQEIRLSNPQVTELVHRHSVADLQKVLARYLAYKDEIWILIDNLDKGWPSAGLTDADVMIVRCLLDGVEKLRRQLNRKWDVPCVPIILLRNDVYEHLIERSSDRGKFNSVSVDWVDREQLKEVLRRRFVYSGMDEELGFDEIWARIAVRKVGEQHSIDFLLERCLMRPRPLLDLFMSCRGYAVNRNHDVIREEDFIKGAEDYSFSAVEDISLEIRDVARDIENALYLFIGKPPTMRREAIIRSFQESGVPAARYEEFYELLLWYGVLGVEVVQDEFRYIYDMNYNFRMMITLSGKTGARFCINKAFRSALAITDPVRSAQGHLI